MHLIGHSASVWVVNQAAVAVAARTQADIHITFLDAYVPNGWKEKALGQLACEPPRRCWVEHYFTRDLLQFTENELTRAHNVDVTNVNPGFNGHRFPMFWYQATIAGRYAPAERFADKPVWCQVSGIAYGFTRGRESGEQSWIHSTALKPVGESVRIRRQDGNLPQRHR